MKYGFTTFVCTWSDLDQVLNQMGTEGWYLKILQDWGEGKVHATMERRRTGEEL